MARKMKDSGIEWIGEIPEEWELSKIKHLFVLGRGRVISQNELKKEGYPVYSSQTKDNGCLGYIDTYDYDKSQLTWTTDGANAGTVFIRQGQYNCTNVCGTLLPRNEKHNLLYLKYALEYIALYHKRADINGYKIMNNEMAKIIIMLPNIKEQQRIADFLDQKCAQIDEILQKTRDTIAEYKKLKQSIITQAVTKGVRGKRPMKDSGIEWIGEIPEEWETGKVKKYYNIQIGFTPDTKNELLYDDTNGYDWVNISDMIDGQTIINTKKKISQYYIEICKPKIIPKGSLMYSFKLSVGQTAYAGKNIYSNEAIASFLPSETVNLFFLRYSSIFIILNAQTNIYNAKILNQDLIKNAYVIFPTLDEQQRIADFLDQKCAEIDKLIEKKEQLVSELESYKKSLIYEYVTGKKEVVI